MGHRQLGAGLARSVCDRHRGLGADGLLRAGPPPGSGEAMTFELRNADGSEAEMSGNGLRCLVHAVIESGALDASALDASALDASVVKAGALAAPTQAAPTQAAPTQAATTQAATMQAVTTRAAGLGIDLGIDLAVLTPVGRRDVHVRDLRDGWMWASTEMGTPKVLGAESAAT